MDEHGWLIKGLEEAADRVKSLPEWAKETSSAIEDYYSGRSDGFEKGFQSGDETHSPLRTDEKVG